MTIIATESRPSAPIEQPSSMSSATPGIGQSNTSSAIPSLFELLLLQQVTAEPASTSDTPAASSTISENTTNGATTVADSRLRSTTVTHDGLTAAAAAIVNLFAANQTAAGLSSNMARPISTDTSATPSAVQPFATGKNSPAAAPFLKMFAASVPSGATAPTSHAIATSPVATSELGNNSAADSTNPTAALAETSPAAKTADIQGFNDPRVSTSIPSASIPLLPVESTKSASANLPTIDLVQRQILHFPIQGTSINDVTAASVTSLRAILPTVVVSSVDSTRDHDSDAFAPTGNVVPGATVSPATAKDVLPAVGEELATSIIQQLSDDPTGGTTTVRLRVDREDLGAVHLHLSVNNDVVSVRIVTQDQVARQIIDSQMADLRQALTGGGISLGQFKVTCDGGHGQTSNGSRFGQASASVSRPSARGWTRSQPASESESRSVGRLNIVA